MSNEKTPKVDRLGLLRDIMRNLAREDHKPGVITQQDLNNSPFAKAKIGPDATIGVKREGARSLYELADSMFTSSAMYRRGTTFDDLSDAMTDIIIMDFIEHRDREATPADLALVERKIEDWFQGRSATHQLYVPCIMTRYPAPAFSVGPVQFTHIEAFAAAKRTELGQMYDFEFGPLFNDMAHNGAGWMATVDVDRCTKDRAWELGELAVDIALVGVQLALPPDKGCMARMTGRTVPRFRRSVSRSDGQMSGAMKNQEPALSIGPGFLEACLTQADALMTAVGLRIRSFLGGDGTLPYLEQAWTDAAYWFLEGLAEPLDTIAVPKFETAIEVLLRSESSSGSKSRVIDAIRVFYGLMPDQLINPRSAITVDAFAKDLVRDRSRILHGTWSTLTHPLHYSRANLAVFVRDLLIRYVLEIDPYAATKDANDNVEKFLAHLETERAKRVNGLGNQAGA